MRILLVEDDAMIASGLRYALSGEGFEAAVAGSVALAERMLAEESFSLGILDLALPDGDGFSLCEKLRAKNTPVIFLTAVDDEANTVRGLEMGADDYITKPFRLRELLARVKAVLRRGGKAPDVIRIGGDITLWPAKAKAFRGEAEIPLTALEYRLLLVFAENRGQVLSRGRLLEGLWDAAGAFVEDNTLSVYIRRLREKLGDDELIKTVRGMGYRLD